MICDQTNNYKGELSMAQKQSNTNLSTLLFIFMNLISHLAFAFFIKNRFPFLAPVARVLSTKTNLPNACNLLLITLDIYPHLMSIMFFTY